MVTQVTGEMVAERAERDRRSFFYDVHDCEESELSNALAPDAVGQGNMVCALNDAQSFTASDVTPVDHYLDGGVLPHKVSLLDSIEWCAKSWSSIAPDTIRHCWRHAGLLVDRSQIAALLCDTYLKTVLVISTLCMLCLCINSILKLNRFSNPQLRELYSMYAVNLHQITTQSPGRNPRQIRPPLQHLSPTTRSPRR